MQIINLNLKLSKEIIRCERSHTEVINAHHTIFLAYQ